MVTGTQQIRVETRSVSYTITLRRKYTILQGDSGTGKSSIRRAVETYRRTKGKCNIKLRSNYEIVILPFDEDQGLIVLEHTHNSIVVVDENARYMQGKAFATLANTSDNYFLLMTRLPLGMLSYSYKDILRLDTVYNTISNTYETTSNSVFTYGAAHAIFDTIITEDSTGGRKVFKAIYKYYMFDNPHTDTVDYVTNLCGDMGEPGYGKGTLLSRIEKHIDHVHGMLVIADGAAIGSHIYDLVVHAQNEGNKVTLWLPESFEFLLLLSGIIEIPNLDMLLNTQDYIDITQHASWESFYTYLCELYTVGSKHPYKKSKLSVEFLSPGNLDKIKELIPVGIKPAE